MRKGSHQKVTDNTCDYKPGSILASWVETNGELWVRQEFRPGELWLGLRKIQQLTTEGDYSLHVILKDFDNKTYQAVYDHFEVIKINAYIIND